MNGYIAFYNGKQKEIYAASSYAAQQAAEKHFNTPKSKRHMISVVLAEKDGKHVMHSTAAV